MPFEFSIDVAQESDTHSLSHRRAGDFRNQILRILNGLAVELDLARVDVLAVGDERDEPAGLRGGRERDGRDQPHQPDGRPPHLGANTNRSRGPPE